MKVKNNKKRKKYTYGRDCRNLRLSLFLLR